MIETTRKIKAHFNNDMANNSITKLARANAVAAFQFRLRDCATEVRGGFASETAGTSLRGSRWATRCGLINLLRRR